MKNDLRPRLNTDSGPEYLYDFFNSVNCLYLPEGSLRIFLTNLLFKLFLLKRKGCIIGISALLQKLNEIKKTPKKIKLNLILRTKHRQST